MDLDRVTSFQKAPAEANYKCGQCGTILSFKQGQLVPPCPRCGFREFFRTDEGIPC